MSSVEEDIYKFVSSSDDIRQINLPQTEEFVINDRQQRIHVRSFFPVVEPKAIVIFTHGMAAHCNRPTFPHIAKCFTDLGIAFLTFDMHGHGYSDGARQLITAKEDILNDLFSIISALYTTSASKSMQFHLNKHELTCPFFLSGQSLGGLTSVVAALEIRRWLRDDFNATESNHTHIISSDVSELRSLALKFSGCMLLCPALLVDEPHTIVKLVLEYLVVPLFPDNPIPSFLSKITDPLSIWENKNYIAYTRYD